MEKEVDINTTLQHEGYNCCCGASAAAQRGSGLAADREQLRSLHEKKIYTVHCSAPLPVQNV